MMTNARWMTAIHESGHAVAAIVLGGRCSHLTVWPDGGGAAWPDSLSPLDLAFATAAGPIAQKLFADEPAPEVATAAGEVAAAPKVTRFTTAKLNLMAIASRTDETPTDEWHIAQFCIAGLEEAPPERWAQRFYFIHATAERIVADHRDAILRVASELFRTGLLEEKRITELVKANQ